MPIQLILDVEHGIGITKCALLAQMDGFSMPTRSAFQFLINAQLTITAVIALLALKDMT
jgi:hypothetical protein